MRVSGEVGKAELLTCWGCKVTNFRPVPISERLNFLYPFKICLFHPHLLFQCQRQATTKLITYLRACSFCTYSGLGIQTEVGIRVPFG